METIKKALNNIEDLIKVNGKPIIKFKEIHDQEKRVQYIKVIRSDGCYSYVGRQQLRFQYLSLGTDCFCFGMIAHQFMHALGNRIQ